MAILSNKAKVLNCKMNEKNFDLTKQGTGCLTCC